MLPMDKCFAHEKLRHTFLNIQSSLYSWIAKQPVFLRNFYHHPPQKHIILMNCFIHPVFSLYITRVCIWRVKLERTASIFCLLTIFREMKKMYFYWTITTAFAATTAYHCEKIAEKNMKGNNSTQNQCFLSKMFSCLGLSLYETTCLAINLHRNLALWQLRNKYEQCRYTGDDTTRQFLSL